MDAFWKWMEAKEEIDYRSIEFTKQMLIGYMIEYLIERDVIDVSHFFDGPFFLNSIDNVYQYIVDKILDK